MTQCQTKLSTGVAVGHVNFSARYTETSHSLLTDMNINVAHPALAPGIERFSLPADLLGDVFGAHVCVCDRIAPPSAGCGAGRPGKLRRLHSRREVQ